MLKLASRVSSLLSEKNKSEKFKMLVFYGRRPGIGRSFLAREFARSQARQQKLAGGGAASLLLCLDGAVEAAHFEAEGSWLEEPGSGLRLCLKHDRELPSFFGASLQAGSRPWQGGSLFEAAKVLGSVLALCRRQLKDQGFSMTWVFVDVAAQGGPFAGAALAISQAAILPFVPQTLACRMLEKDLADCREARAVLKEQPALALVLPNMLRRHSGAENALLEEARKKALELGACWVESAVYDSAPQRQNLWRYTNYGELAPGLERDLQRAFEEAKNLIDPPKRLQRSTELLSYSLPVLS